MRVNALDHINISTVDLVGSAHFYADLLDLEIRNGPAMLPADQVRWLYDHKGHAIIHLVKRDPVPGATGPIDHVALNCSGKEDVLARLRARAAEFSVYEVAEMNQTLIFTRDPHGVLLELNFRGE
jgi:hypothetical protein